MMPNDPLTALLDLVRTAAREGTTQALASCTASGPPAEAPLLDKRALAHALCVSTATVDRMCRQKRIPFVIVGEVRRFDLDAVRAALGARGAQAEPVTEVHPDLGGRSSPVRNIRLLSRGGRK